MNTKENRSRLVVCQMVCVSDAMDRFCAQLVVRQIGCKPDVCRISGAPDCSCAGSVNHQIRRVQVGCQMGQVPNWLCPGSVMCPIGWLPDRSGARSVVCQICHVVGRLCAGSVMCRIGFVLDWSCAMFTERISIGRT